MTANPAGILFYLFIAFTQSADSLVSSLVDSSAQHTGMRPNLIATKNKNSQSQIETSRRSNQCSLCLHSRQTNVSENFFPFPLSRQPYGETANPHIPIKKFRTGRLIYVPVLYCPYGMKDKVARYNHDRERGI